MKHYYLELKQGDKVCMRKKTSLASESKDRKQMKQFQKHDQEIEFVVSSTKEKLIHNL